MKFNVQMSIRGMKASQGEVEGYKYNTTKVYAEVELDNSGGNAKGCAVAVYSFGTADDFKKYEHLEFPFTANCQMEISTNGTTQKTKMLSCVPMAAEKKAA